MKLRLPSWFKRRTPATEQEEQLDRLLHSRRGFLAGLGGVAATLALPPTELIKPGDRLWTGEWESEEGGLWVPEGETLSSFSDFIEATGPRYMESMSRLLDDSREQRYSFGALLGHA